MKLSSSDTAKRNKKIQIYKQIALEKDMELIGIIWIIISISIVVGFLIYVSKQNRGDKIYPTLNQLHEYCKANPEDPRCQEK